MTGQVEFGGWAFRGPLTMPLLLGCLIVRTSGTGFMPGGSHNAKVAAILSRHTDLVQTSGLALDIACGQGTNALALAALGMEVDAWDISAVAIEQLKDAAHRQRLAVNARIVDITPDMFSRQSLRPGSQLPLSGRESHRRHHVSP